MWPCPPSATRQPWIKQRFRKRSKRLELTRFHQPTERPMDIPLLVRSLVIKTLRKGLAYLHELEPKVVHRDIKSSNILIDDKFNSKISDFLLCEAAWR
ncbi:unnamed protein product [Brassica oleracea]